MFDPTRRLLEEIAEAIDKHAPAKLRSADELARWAKREHERAWLLLDGGGRWLPLSPEQIARGAQLAARRRSSEG